MIKRHNSKGFTLIELAVVLVVVSVLLGSFIGTLSGRVNVTKKSNALEELEDIKQSLLAHAFVYGYLPCPDCEAGSCPNGTVGDGIADYTSAGACSKGEAAANVPWVTLGLGRGDPWGNHYRYAVQAEYSDSSTPFTLDGASGPPGTASIKEPDYVADATGGTWHSLADNVVAVIFSHGSNGFGAYSEDNQARPAIPSANTDEKENTDNDGDFYMRPDTTADATIAGGEFDDIVIWISEYELKAKMVEAGKLP